MQALGGQRLAGVAGEERAHRLERALWWTVGVATFLILAAATASLPTTPLLLAVTAGLVLAAFGRALLAWPTLLGAVIVVILLIPIRRYTIAIGTPVALEPYRVLIALVLMGWLAALLVDPRTRFQKTGTEAPVLLLIASILISLALNVHRVTELDINGEIIKKITFIAGFLLVTYFTSSAINTAGMLDRIVKLLVGGGTLVALLSIIEWRTGLNAFNNLESFVPLLHLDPAFAGDPLSRGFRVRAYASAQHPIALGALLVMLMPLAFYLRQRTGKTIWVVCAAMLTMGAMATTSRTVVVMLATMLVVFLWLKRAETVRLTPLLLPLIVVCQILMPGTLGTFKSVLFPQSGSLVSEQQGGAGTGTGRVADLGPSLREAERTPLFGQGFGTRLTSEDDPFQNAQILDDQWLSSLLEIGAVGVLALLWLYVRSVRLLAAKAKHDASAHGWLLTAFAASITAFATGMLTYDAFSFIQVTVLSFLLIGLGAVALRLSPASTSAAKPA